MGIPEVLMLAAASVAAILLTLSRVVGTKTIIKYSVLVDVLATILFFVVFAGTLGGTLVAVMAGLFMAIILTIAKSLMPPVKSTKEVKRTTQLLNDLMKKSGANT